MIELSSFATWATRYHCFIKMMGRNNDIIGYDRVNALNVICEQCPCEVDDSNDESHVGIDVIVKQSANPRESR